MVRHLPERLFGALLGSLIGFATWMAAIGWLPEADPDTWTMRAPMAPIAGAELAGGVRPDPQKLDLWAYRGASPKLAPFNSGELRVTANVPDDGELHVMVGAREGHAGPAAPTRRDQRQTAPHAFGPTLVVDRSRGTVYGARGLSCEPMDAPGQYFELTLTLGQPLQVAFDGTPAGTCRGQIQPGQLVLTSGVRRVQVQSVSAPGFEDDFHSFLRGPAAWLAAFLLGAAAFTQARWVLGAVPALTVPFLATLDGRATLDALRLVSVPEGAVPFLLGAVPALALLLVTVAAGNRRRLVGLTMMTVGLSIAAGAPPVLACAWLPWAGLAWVNRNPVRFRGLWSYGALAAALVMLEVGLRTSSADATWKRTEGYERAMTEFQELLELQQYRDYPSEGFPVQPPPPSEAFRVVALGGSSTGGAFQMDDLDQFWPARLQRELGVEVVNQGVGGWNTLHIRLYVASQLERLDPDLLVLYVGHNDILTESPLPYARLYEGYGQANPLAPLEASRVFFGFRFTLLALRDRDPAVSVPLDDAYDNLTALLELGVPTLLVTEGLNPDPRPMDAYTAMMKERAEAFSGRHLDAAQALYALNSPDLFIDDCHLTEQGHDALARLIARDLEDAGWVSDRPRSLGGSPPPPGP